RLVRRGLHRALTVTILVLSASVLRAQTLPPVDATGPRKVTLAECLRIAADQQPALAGHRASLAAAEAQEEGLEKIPIPSCLSRELSVRRKQAMLGVTIASAGPEQAQFETTYSVRRTYLTVRVARRQQDVA